MEGAAPRIDPELLLANSAWLHALARSLVADDHRADDVVQQTFAAAVEHPPGDGVPLRPWLARVARNFSLKALRSEGRRADREARVPAPPPTASPAESVARAETFRDVVDAVLALEPIYRDVVIARFFDGLEMTDVAARLGVPEETARTRLKRAIATLRDRLDRRHGDRRAWALLLVGRRAAPTAAGVAGGIVVAKIVAAAAVAAVGGSYALRVFESPGRTERADDAAVVETTTAAPAARHRTPRSRVATPAAGASATTAVRTEPGATLLVRVTEAGTRRPIADATVVLREQNVVDTTDAAGTVRFLGLSARKWMVTVDAPHHRGGGASTDVAGDGVTAVDVVLPLSATIDVRCVDPSGVEVRSFGIRYDVLGDAGPGGMAATDESGRCEFPVPADAVVRITAQTMRLAHTSVAVPTGPAGAPPVTVTLRLAPEAHLAGVVRDPDGKPAGGAIVRAVPSAARPAEFDRTRGGIEGTADGEGRYSLGGLVRGRRYDVVATAARWAPSVVVEDVAVPDGGAETSLDLALRRFTDLVVRVTGPNGEPVPGAGVTCMRMGPVVSVVTVQPESAGVFVLKAQPPGEVSVLATAPGLSPFNRIVDVGAGGITEVTMQVGVPTPAIAGVVVDETGAAVAGSKVSFRLAPRDKGNNVIEITTSDVTGRFRGSAFGDGPLVVDAAAPGHVPVHGLELPGPSEDVRIVMRRAATVVFRLVAEDDAPPIRGIRLLFGGSARAEMIYSDARNAVRLEKEARGDTEMRLYVERFAPVIRRVKLDAGAVDDLGEIRLVAPAPLSGRVVDADGRPVANAAVRLDMDDADLMLKSVRTDGDGAFTAPLAPPSGAVPLRVEAPGFLTLRTSVAVGGDAPVTLRLARGGVVWGEVVDASGAPVPGATVSVTDADGGTTTSGADDCGLFGARVRAGRCAVAVDAASASADVADGGELHVRVVVPAR